MKAIFPAVSAAALSLTLAACAPSATPPHTAGKPVRSGSGNAELQGPSADEVIWRSTDQWHADRWHDRRRRH